MSFGERIYTCKATMVEAEEDQSNLLENLVVFNNKSRQKNKQGKDKKRGSYESEHALYEGWELTLNVSKSETFSIKETQVQGFKTSTLKQIFQR